MKKITYLIIFLLTAAISNAQKFDRIKAQNEASVWVDMMIDPSANVFEAKQAFDIYWKQRDVSKKEISKGKGYKVFLRWQEYMKTRVLPNGKKVDAGIAAKEIANFNKKNKLSSRSVTGRSVSGTWAPMGPTKVTGTVANGSFQSPGGSGRINCIAFDPNNSNVIWAGSPAGGLWKSVNGGVNWTTNTDQLSVLGVSSIVIDPTNTNIMYIATGDGEAGDTYSSGVLKSTDGGLTWNPTALSKTADNKWKIRRIVMNPSNPAIMYVASNGGLIKTTDGFATITTAATGNIYDVELKPGTPSTVYGVGVTSGATKFYVSTDGTTFALAGTSLPATGVQRVSIAVSAAAPNNVWALAGQSSDQGFMGFYTSTNSGTSFVTTFASGTNKNLLGWNTNFSDAGGQAFYDLALAVNPTNAQEIFIGGVNLQKSTNGGTSWTCNGYWMQGSTQQYVHADHHALEYQNGSTLFDGNDGGVFKTANNGTVWTDISNDMSIAQVAAFGISQLNPNLMLTGHQDNGTNKYDGASWKIVYGGDGCEAICDPTNQNIMYASYVQGDLKRSTNGGTSWSVIKPSTTETGAWITPFALHPTVNTTIYAGYNNIWRSTTSGTSYTKLGTVPGSGEITAFKVAPSAPSTIYVCKEYWNGTAYVYTVAKTANDGTAWTDLSSKLPVTSAAPVAIEVSPTDANKVWITFSGYSAANKIFYSADGGATFTNISANLPNLPVNCAVYEKSSNDGIYIGTDVGIYFKDASMTNWVAFSSGLPNVIVRELEIYYDNVTPANNKLRAATYGRSVWQSDLYTAAPAPFAVTTTAMTSVANNTAVTGGNVTGDNGNAVTSRGVCYGTASAPDVTGSKTSDGTGTGVFTSNLSGLTAATTYYVRAYATNSTGTVYGSEVSFTTTNVVASLPTVSTTAISAITSSGATSGGNVTADGGAAVTARGVCYSTSANPTVANSVITSGTGTGVFASNFTGLTANTTYYVRAYATNTVGTSYGAEVSFTTSPATAAYCASKGTSAASEWIDLVQLGSINNVTAANAGYGNFTSLSTTIVPGAAYTISYSAGFKKLSYTEYWEIWIDYNQNGTFETSEKVAARSIKSAATLTSTFTVPATATIGATRMRIQMKYGGYATACETFANGEVEDYTVNISATPMHQSVAGSNELAKEDFKIFPNPTSDVINVMFNGVEVITIDVYNMSGAKVKTGSLDSNNNKINVSDLSSGVYNVILNDGKKTTTKRFIKN